MQGVIECEACDGASLPKMKVLVGMRDITGKAPTDTTGLGGVSTHPPMQQLVLHPSITQSAKGMTFNNFCQGVCSHSAATAEATNGNFSIFVSRHILRVLCG